MFEDYTAEALLADVLEKAPAGIDTRQGSIFYDAVSGITEMIAKMYTDIDLMSSYVFIASASGEYLDMKAAEYGLSRQSATAAKYYLNCEGTTPTVGSRFFHSDTGLYFSVTSVSVTDTVTESIVTAATAGTEANEIPEGDPAVPVITISGLKSSLFGEIYANGTDEETDDDLRTRIQEKIAGPAENGNKQHYKTWCENIDGVGLARILPLWDGANTVKAVLITADGLPCSDDVVSTVQETIDPESEGLGEGLANLGAHFTAVAATEYALYVKFTAELSSTADEESAVAEAEEAIESYLTDLVMQSETDTLTVRITAIGAIVANCTSITDYSNLQINESENNITIESDGVPVLKGVTISV